MRATRLFTLLQRTVETVIPSILLLATALLICLDVFMRYVLSHPITGAGEIVITLLVWQVMLGSAGVARDRGHIAVDALTSRFSGVARAWIDAVRLIITVAVVAFLAYFGAQLFFQTSGRIVAMLGISRGFTTLAVPIGALLMLVYYGRDLLLALRGIRTGNYTPPSVRQVVRDDELVADANSTTQEMAR
jgi:TRAP-type C4-dicarboxylate transport system permease small subunit